MSPLLDDSVKDGVPSVHVGVEPSTEAGGVHASPREWLECPAPELPDSTLNVDLFSILDSKRMSDTLEFQKNMKSKLESDKHDSLISNTINRFGDFYIKL